MNAVGLGGGVKTGHARASAISPEQAHQQADQGGFARPVRADQAGDFTEADPARNIVQGRLFTAGKALAQTLDDYGRVARLRRLSMRLFPRVRIPRPAGRIRVRALCSRRANFRVGLFFRRVAPTIGVHGLPLSRCTVTGMPWRRPLSGALTMTRRR